MSQIVGGHKPTNRARALSVSALILIDGLGADPEADAQAYGAEREALHLPGSQAGIVQAFGQHGLGSTAEHCLGIALPLVAKI